MHPEYLKDSDTAGVFLAEDTYEWGYSLSDDGLPLRPGSIESNIWPLCCRRGRENAAQGNRPFEGRYVILLSSPPTEGTGEDTSACKGPTRDVLEAIVHAGGGVPLEYEEQSQGNKEGVLHVSCCTNHVAYHQDKVGAFVIAPTDLMDMITQGPQSSRQDKRSVDDWTNISPSGASKRQRLSGS